MSININEERSLNDFLNFMQLILKFGLTDREAKMFAFRFYHKLSFPQIGKIEGYSWQRVQQLVNIGINKIKLQQNKIEEIKQDLEEEKRYVDSWSR